MHGNISRNGYGNAIIGRYGGCFEEGIWWVYGTGESCAAQERLVISSKLRHDRALKDIREALE